jgi:hypothetical protein
MAKASTVKSSGPARVRLIVFDAEVPDGDFNSLAQVLQNALKAPNVIQRPTIVTGKTKTITHQPTADASQEDEAAEELDTQEVDDVTPTTSKTPRAKRTLRTPKVVALDMNSPVSLESFVQGKDVSSQAKKYMVSAAWLKECRQIDAVTEDHIFTCFRFLGWSTGIPDFGQPLRDLKSKQQFFDKSDKGYEINHLGLDFVRKLGGSNGAS